MPQEYSEQVIRSGLVVDSNFRSRRALLADLSKSGLVGNVIEAKSVGDGLHCLTGGEVDACFIGSSLSNEKKIEFIRRGSAIVRYTPCAFIAVVQEGHEAAHDLIDAGAHGIIHFPYEPESIHTVVREAVTQSHALLDGHELLPDLPVVLEQAANGLRDVLQKIETGSLVVRSDGAPSLATRDALRMVFEDVLVHDSQVRTVGSTDNYFVGGLVDWFVDRINMPVKEATESLRKRLLSSSLDTH